ncbi:DUF2336 domain-containing protein [Afifella pfennigii]|uniref:DUF2336 domain-containing protein n=1 Tax=Afifella pfennigii TaxID=209897 RepID=UPI00068FDC0D|nr:DUF2336 domain-containing protein [Afifella pfennigii]
MMIVERFLNWIGHAVPKRRVEAASALARAFLTSPLNPQERDGLEAAMTILLDDPHLPVRQALAQELAASEDAPHHVMLALAGDHEDVATIVLEHSPLFLDSELVDIVATGGPQAQMAVARRVPVSRALAAAIAEVGELEAAIELLCNPYAHIARFSLERIVTRFGHDAELRQMLLEREDLPASLRQALIAALADSLCAFVASRGWLSPARARAAADEALEKSALAMAEAASPAALAQLVARLLDREELTPRLLIRALVAGQIPFFQEALTAISGMPHRRVGALLAAPGSAALHALLNQAGLPAGVVPGIVAALQVMQGMEAADGASHDYRRATRLIDGILERYSGWHGGEIDELLTLLRRLALEAKRDAARFYARQFRAAA